MTRQTNLGGSFTLPGTSMTLNRMGYGAMQLAGPQVWGPPRDMDGAIAAWEDFLKVEPSGERAEMARAEVQQLKALAK